MADPNGDWTPPISQSQATIATLNDAFRHALHTPGHNRVVMTAGVADLIGDTSLFRGFQRRAELLRTVRDYDAFGSDFDPYGERDFGRFEFAGESLYWKIDLYEDPDVKSANDPPAITRVITIMLPSDY